jgi:penicillin-binding protein 1B
LRALRATGPNWSFPSRVYSDGVPLLVGRTLPEPYLIAELAARGYRPASSPVPAGGYAPIPGGFEIGLRGLPDEPPPLGGGGPERIRVRLADGHLVGLDRLGGLSALPPDTTRSPALEPALVSLLLDEHRVWRTWVSLERVPRGVQEAILASEDRRFYGHEGVDVRGTLRALFQNIRMGEIREGGSTITQQLVRSLFLGTERTIARKLVEVPLAVGVDLLLSKRDILEMYLNSVYWGQAEGFAVGGVAQAARWYFDAPIESLDVLQGATLAAIIPAPNVVNPFKDPAKTIERRNAVLKDLVSTNKLTEEAGARLSALPLNVRRGRPPVERFPSYTGYVASLLDRPLSRNAATRRGLVISTPMDLAWQIAAEEGMAAGLSSLDGGGRRRHLEGAFVALEPATAGIVALVGGRATKPGDFNRAYQARRQTGSAIKPIVYASAFTSPIGLTPATTLPDTLRTFGKGRWAWTPKNFDLSTHAEVTLAKALEKSLNIATANLVDLVGAGSVARTAESFGLGRLKAVASIGLGTNETTLLQLTNAFAVFRAQGMRRTPHAVRWVANREGERVLEPDGGATRALPQGIAALMTGLLQNVVKYGVAYPLRTYGFDRPVAGKTGTTDDFRDAWFVGFTPDVVAGVWVGYDKPRSIGRQAAHTALPVWARVVGTMLAGFPATPFETDTQLQWIDVEPWSGFLADSLCASESIPFLPGTGPLAHCGESSFAMYPYQYENPESLYASDTAWVETGFDEPRDPAGPEAPTPQPAAPETVTAESDTTEIPPP